MWNKFSEKSKGVIALVFLSFVFASMGLFARYLNTGFTISQQVYLRISAALIISLIVFRKDLDFRKIRKISPSEWGLLLFRSLAFYLVGITLFTKAIILTKYSNVAFIGALPIVALLGALILREKMNFKKIMYTIMAFLGVILVAISDYTNLFQWGKGELIALISTISFSLSYIFRRWHSELLNNREITTIMFVLALPFLYLTSLIQGEGIPTIGWNLNLFFAVFGAGLFNVMNMFLTNYGFQKVEAILASNILTLESVFAVLLGFIFYKELPVFKELIGGLIITASVIGINKLEK